MPQITKGAMFEAIIICEPSFNQFANHVNEEFRKVMKEEKKLRQKFTAQFTFKVQTEHLTLQGNTGVFYMMSRGNV